MMSRIKRDRLRNLAAMVLMGIALTAFLPWLATWDRGGETEDGPLSHTSLPESLQGMKIEPLSEPLPQCYRIEDTDGTAAALTPPELLVRLAGWEWNTGEGKLDEAIIRQSLILRMILLHGKALGIMGDRVTGMSREELVRSVWLERKDMAMLGAGEISSLPEETRQMLEEAAETAAPFFLSVDGMLVREIETLGVEEIYDRISAGETAAEIIKGTFGADCIVEQAKPLDSR